MASPAAVLNILITANSTQATAALARTDAQMKKTAATAQATSTSMGSKIAKGAKVGGLAVAALGAISVKAASDWESSFAEVRKTVDTNEKGFKRLEVGLRSLAKEIPISVNELNDLAGQAGALGIKSQDIIKFTKVAAELGVTTDLSADAAANALARLANIMGTSSKDFDRLGSTLVELGNKGASTESEITEMALRIAGAGKQVGLTESQVLSFSSALASVGIRAEAGGSSISRAFITMAEAVEKGGAELSGFSEVAGMSASKFAQLFERDAATAMVSFIEGLEGIRKSGGSVFSTLEGLELNEIRVRDALLRAAGAGDLFTKQLDIGSDEWKRNSALTEEARKRYATFESQIQLLKNTLTDTFVTIGKQLLPDLKEMISILRNPKLTLDEKIAALGDKLGQMVGEWIPKIGAAAVKLGVALAQGVGKAFLDASIWGKLFIGGALLTAIGGKGKLIAVGAALGRFLGIGMASGVAAGVGGGAAGGVAAGAAGAGIAGKIGGVLKNIKWARVGGIAVGAAAADSILQGLEENAKLKSEDVLERIAGHMGKLSPSLFETVITAGMANAADRDVRNQLQDMVDTVQRLADAGLQIRPEKFREFTRIINDAAVPEDFKADLREMLTLVGGPMVDRLDRDAKAIQRGYRKGFDLRQISEEFSSDLKVIQANYGRHSEETAKLAGVAKQSIARSVAAMVKDERISLQKASEFLDRFGLDLRDLGPEFNSMSSKARTAFLDVSRDTREMQNKASANFDQMSNDARDAFHKTAEDGRRESGNLRKGVKANIDGLASAVAQGMGRIVGNTNKALKAFGVKPVNFAVVDGKKTGTSGLQRGGHINMGAPSGDSVPAMLERDEYVLNRKAVKRVGRGTLDAINFGMAPRMQTGGQVGGLNFALGPYTIPPIQYDANHAGGNSHWHITGTTTPWVVAIGKQLQQMGFMVGEHPAFGGVAPGVHSPTGGHYDALAIDVNSAADETRAETAAVARLLGSGKVSGLAGAAVKEIARVLLNGPDGPLKDMGQSALDKVHKAANQFIARKAPTEGLEPGASISADGNVERVFAQVAKRLSRSKIATLALGMAGYAESGMRDLSYGHSSSQGALQLLSSTASGLGVSPHDEGAIASLFFNRGFYGRGGANSLTAQGLPAHLVAQGVQGSATADGSNYLAQAGPARAWMSRFGLKRGGVVGLQKGGIVGELVDTIYGSSSGGERHDVLQKFSKGIKRVGLGDKASNSLAGLRAKVAEYTDYADRASQLGQTDDNGNLIPGTDIVKGMGEVQWVTEQLNALFKLRNRLVEAQEIIDKHRKRMSRLLDRARKHLQRIQKEIRQGEKERADLLKKIEDSKHSNEQSKKHAQAQLDKELDKPKRKQDKDLIARLRDQIRAGGGVEGLREQLGKIVKQQKKRGWVEEALRGKIIPTIEGQQGKLNTTRGDLLSELDTIQGPGSPAKTLDKLPILGFLGGDIFSAQSRLAELNAPREIFDEVTDSGSLAADSGVSELASQRADLLEQLLRESTQRGAVREAFIATARASGDLFPDIPAFAKGGRMAQAGMALVGERGPELVGLPSGAQVHSNPDSQALMTPDVQVILNGDLVNTPPGRDPVELVINDRRFPAAVAKASRGNNRFVGRTPGGRR